MAKRVNTHNQKYVKGQSLPFSTFWRMIFFSTLKSLKSFSVSCEHVENISVKGGFFFFVFCYFLVRFLGIWRFPG